MQQAGCRKRLHPGRAPYGARGLKYLLVVPVAAVERRAPYGARGLKWLYQGVNSLGFAVAPRMGRVD